MGKQLAVFGVAGGVGWDRYTGNALIRVRAPALTPSDATIPVALGSSRAMVFLDAGFNLALLKLVAEVGYQTANDQKLSTDFEDFDTNKGKFYGGLGLRVGL